MRPYLAGVVLGMLSTAPVFAVFGVGDVVIVASNPAQELLWAANELPKWTELLQKTQQQLSKAQQMVDIVGDPKGFAESIVAGATPNLALAEQANDLKARTDVLDFTRTSWTLSNATKSLRDDVLNVAPTYKVFGAEVSRDREKYVKLAMEKALSQRLREALEKKQAVDKKELAFQQQTLARLKSVTTQNEIALHQAALAASQQRMQLAAARVTQAQNELDEFKNNLALERKKEREQTKEWASTVLDKALEEAERARTAGGRRSRSFGPIGPEGWNRSDF